MALFQQSVIKKYLQELDSNFVNSAFDKFHKHFGNTEIQNNIREAKEEQYQEGFLRELFVDVLGYTLYPQTNYNLITEQKNEKDSKKADGAIIQKVADATCVIAVIELKGTATTDLSKVEVQAFSYKNNQKDCKYVITSNFEKIRFYIDNAIDFEEFNLFNLTKDRFNLLYLCLAKENLLNGIPLKIKESSVSQEENITKKLYSDYSAFKRLLFQNICSLNPEYDKLTLFQKTQKLLDRFLFIFFAEDRLLLPPNSIREIIKQWEQLKDLDNYTPLYDRFKKYFGYMNTGFKGKQYEIFAYNGGLFAPNEILDNLKINDQILFENALKLSNYDYDTEVDVNILGHIFEHSLNEIEEIQSELEGKELDKSKTKRKKDGVFYTPKYITKYIVENTVGALCTEKKKELEINDEEIVISKRKDKKKELIEKIDNYRNWLLKLTICDPACGSGAFLNQALDYLLIEHKKLDELKARITNSPMILSDIENSVLENNIFGVDLNEEAVEIAKLSLWLKTAQKGRKLSILTSNIKCGNSLIDDVNIVGEKAFNWKNEFPEIFSNGGFDIIIGNPPYGAKFTEQEKEFCKKEYYKSTEGKIDSYRIFIEKCFNLGNSNALISLITPNTFLYNLQSYSLRKLIFECASIYDAVELRKNIFEDAPDVVTVIISFKNIPNENYFFRARVAYHNKPYSDINSSSWEIDQNISIDGLKKENDLKINLRSNSNFSSINSKLALFETIDNHFNLKQGTKPYGQKENKEIELLSKTKVDDSWEKAINGRNISRYYLEFENDYVQRSEELHSALPLKIVRNEKIYFQRMRKISLFPRIVACYDNDNFHGLYTCSVITKKNDSQLDLKYLLCLLNSKLINLWYKYFDTDIEIKLASVKQVPIPVIPYDKQLIFIEKANLLLEKKKEYNNSINEFLHYFKSKYAIEKPNTKFLNWNNLEYKDWFIVKMRTFFIFERKKVNICHPQVFYTMRMV